MTVITQTYTFSGAGEDFGPRRGRRLAILHTFENADPLKNTMRDAVAGAIWQDRNDILGSYNRLIAVDGVLGCVPDTHSSGGVNPGSDYWAPKAWLYSLLPAYVVNDPNAYALQLCAMGRREWYDANGWPPEIIDGYARSIIEEEQAAGVEIVVANHADFQSNRSDAGGALPLVMKRIAELKSLPVLPDTAMEPDMPALTEYTGDWVTIDANANIRDENGNLLFRTARASGALRVGKVGDNSVFWIKDRNRWGFTDTAANIVAAVPLEQAFTVKVVDQAAIDSAVAALNKNLDVWVSQRPTK